MTFEEALEWLEKCGGEWRVGHQTEDYDSVAVYLGGPLGNGPSRQALFHAHLRGSVREAAIRQAMVRACEALMVGLVRPRKRPDTMTSTYGRFSRLSWASAEPDE